MPDLGGGLLGCYRCGYVWRLRKSPVRLCPRCKSTQWNRPRVLARDPPRARTGQGLADVVGPRRRGLLALASRFGVSRVRVFGSVARGDATPDSDVDLLVKFREPIGLLARMEFKDEVARLLGRPVDVATEASLHWLIRPAVLEEAVDL